MIGYDVFISRKSSDADLAKILYDYLTSCGLKVFDSDISLEEIGITEYQAAIDKILENVSHMIVLGSSVENIMSSWVQTEWSTFENERRSGRKQGNILVVLGKRVKVEMLPLTLRQKQAFVFDKSNFKSLLPYLKKDVEIVPPIEPKRGSTTMLTIGLIALVGAAFVIFFYSRLFSETPPEDKTEVILFNVDSVFTATKKAFLEEGLDKELTLSKFKEVLKNKPSYVLEVVETFEKKAEDVPFLKAKYLNLSEEILVYTDSLNNAN